MAKRAEKPTSFFLVRKRVGWAVGGWGEGEVVAVAVVGGLPSLMWPMKMWMLTEVSKANLWGGGGLA